MLRKCIPLPSICCHHFNDLRISLRRNFQMVAMIVHSRLSALNPFSKPVTTNVTATKKQICFSCYSRKKRNEVNTCTPISVALISLLPALMAFTKLKELFVDWNLSSKCSSGNIDFNIVFYKKNIQKGKVLYLQ